MKKMVICGYNSCGCHNERAMIESYIDRSDFKEFEYIEEKDIKEADVIIVLDTCFGTYHNFSLSLAYIQRVLKEKKDSAKVIVSGCITKGVKFELTGVQKAILSDVICVKQEEIVPYVTKLLNPEITEEELKIMQLPFDATYNHIKISPVEGCLNHCSFCKTHYANFTLRSHPFEEIETFTHMVESMESPISHISVFSSNLSLYGVDLYQKSRAHEIIQMLTSPEKIQFAFIGTLINFYPELIKEVINNPKIKEVSISIESGSPRIYELMNRPISLEKLKQIIKLIRQERPDIIINTDIIVGFPTETIDDMKMTIDLLYELDIYPNHIYYYLNSKQIPSSQLPQHSLAYLRGADRYMQEKLRPLCDKFQKRIWDGEMIVIEKFEDCYEVQLVDGHTRYLGFQQLDRDYQIGEKVQENTVKPKIFVKRGI